VLPDGFHLRVGRQRCGLALDGWGGRAGVAGAGGHGLRGAVGANLWLAHSSPWSGMASRQHRPLATVPA